MRIRLIGLLVALLTLGLSLPAAAQDGNALIEMTVDAGYDTYFRDDQWFPVRVTVTNNSDPVDARVVVRPQTSRGVRGTFSLPIDLPTNARKTDVLEVIATGVVTQLRVELIEQGTDAVLASRTVPVSALAADEHLYVVVTASAAGSVDLTGATGEGMSARQANWEIATIPDDPAALEAVNTLVFSDIDTGGLTIPQEDALRAWVAGGGHLVVTGGPGWQQTAAGLERLLPLVPGDSTTISEVSALAGFIANSDDLQADTVAATGTLADGAQVLVQTEDDVPLLVRQSLGDGTVDYLAVDPIAEPLRSWAAMSDVWYALVATRAPLPSWASTFQNWESARAAVEIMPGLDVLPSVLPICGFLALYIALVGPLNYLVLNRLNRREFAWLTIPVLIAVFSVLAWVVGGELRGNDASVSRLSVVRSWQNTDVAHTTELVGLLSPQRTRYTLEPGESSVLRSIPAPQLVSGANNPLQSSFQNSIDIQQASGFRAIEFPVDASFVAGFAAYGTTAAPDITGSATLFYNEVETETRVSETQFVRGSVRNNTDQTLEDGVVLARNSAYRLREPLLPGELADFEMRLDGNEMAAPAPIGYNYAQNNLSLSYNPGFNTSSGRDPINQTVRDIIGDGNFQYNPLLPTGVDANTAEEQEERRRQLMLQSLMQDTLYSTGRGNDVYFVGWADSPPGDVTLPGSTYDPYNSVLYVVQLNVDVQQPDERIVRVSADQFVWAVHEREATSSSAPISLRVGEGSRISFRYTPLPEARLDEVTQLRVRLTFNTGGNRNIPLQVWNWQRQEWEGFVAEGGQLDVDDPAAYIGPQNAVLVQLDGAGNLPSDINTLYVEQIGRYSS